VLLGDFEEPENTRVNKPTKKCARTLQVHANVSRLASPGNLGIFPTKLKSYEDWHTPDLQMSCFPYVRQNPSEGGKPTGEQLERKKRRVLSS